MRVAISRTAVCSGRVSLPRGRYRSKLNGSVLRVFESSFMNLPCTISSAKPLLLVADDDRDSADYLGLLLQASLRCEVATAYDGGDALAQARARPPVAMILDLEMPVCSGTGLVAC